MRFSKWKINEAAANDGDWIGDLDGFEDFAIHTRSMDCHQAIDFQRKLSKQIMGRARTRRDKDIPPEILDYINAQTLIEICISNWKNAVLPVDADGAICFDDERIEDEKEFAFSKEVLATVLLEDAPDGIEIHKSGGKATQTFHTKDKKKARFAMRDFLYALVDAADSVAAPDDKAMEKNGSGAGSPGTGDDRSTQEPKTETNKTA